MPHHRRTLSAAGRLLARHWILAPVVLLYLYSFPYFEWLNSPNELVRVYMTMAIVDDGSYDIEPVCRRYTWVNDRSVVGDRAYSSKAPGASFAGVPFYAGAKAWAALRGRPLERREIVHVLRIGVCVVPALVFLVVFRRFLMTLGARPFTRDLVFLGYALGTPAFTYIHQFSGHVPSACALFGAYVVWDSARRAGPSHWRRGAAFGMLLGWAPVMEYQALIPAAVLGIAFLADRKARTPAALLAALVAGCVPVGLLMHFHTAAFGSPLSTGYAYIENPAFRMMLEEGWMGLTYPRASRLAILTLSTECGLVFFSPFLAFGLLALLPLARRRTDGGPAAWPKRHVVACGAVVVTLLLFISANILWRAGWTAGPRYLTALVPFACVLALVGLGEAERLWGWPARAAALAGLLLAVFFSGASGAIYPHFPVTFHNPVFELLVPMLRDGFVPYNLGRSVLGITGTPGYVPAILAGVVPPVAWLVALAEPSWARRTLVLVTAILVSVLACLHLDARARRAPMPAWGLDDLAAVYTNWEPVDAIDCIERAGCETLGSVWRIRCPDAVTAGRVQMRLGLKATAAMQYEGRSPGRAPPSYGGP